MLAVQAPRFAGWLLADAITVRTAYTYGGRRRPSGSARDALFGSPIGRRRRSWSWPESISRGSRCWPPAVLDVRPPLRLSALVPAAGASAGSCQHSCCYVRRLRGNSRIALVPDEAGQCAGVEDLVDPTRRAMDRDACGVYHGADCVQARGQDQINTGIPPLRRGAEPAVAAQPRSRTPDVEPSLGGQPERRMLCPTARPPILNRRPASASA